MNIVVLDGHTVNPGDLDWADFSAHGSLTVYDRTPSDQIIPRAKEADILLVNKTILTSGILEALPRLRYIGLLSTGYNVVDLHTAKERGIPVCNIPAYSTHAVTQMVFALLLELCGHISRHSRAVHEGEWSDCPDFCFWKAPLTELAGKTIGIIGMGSIGRQTARAAHAFGMRILACTPHPKPVEGVKYVELSQLFAQADVVTLHCPLTDQTQGMINKASLAQMKPAAFLINTARGGLVADADLAEALESGGIAGAGLDVLSQEPPPAGNPLIGAKNCIITPHIAWAAHETRARLLRVAAENLRAFLAGSPQNNVY